MSVVKDKEAVWLTLSMFRDNSQVEAFLPVDAVPGYLQVDDHVGARSDDISPLLKCNGVILTLGQRMMRHAATMCSPAHMRSWNYRRGCYPLSTEA